MMDWSSSSKRLYMSDVNANSYPKVTPLNAWFIRLDKQQRRLFRSGRFRVLLLSSLLLALLLLNIYSALLPQAWPSSQLLQSAAWINGSAMVLLLLLLWTVWRELLQPLLSLSRWAELMRGVKLDARVQLAPDSDFTELANDINMLANMIQQLSRDTEIQLEKHTDYISRESRSLAILCQITSSINLSYDLNEAFGKSLQSMCENLNASAGIVRHFRRRNQQEIVALQGAFNDTFLESLDHFLPIEDRSGENDDGKIFHINSLDQATVLTPDEETAPGKLLVLSILIQYRKGIRGAVHLFFPGHSAPELEKYDDLLLSIGQHLGSAIERFRLIEEESELLVMQERTRLSHELHDSLAQTIASLRIQIRVIDETFHSRDEESIWHQMERIEYTIDEANDQLRELIAHFRVPINEHGLIPSMEAAIQRFKEESDIQIYFQNEWLPQEYSFDVELNLLRIVQECLANVRKHSHAEVVRLLLTSHDGKNILLIEDDGIGFDESTVKSEGGRQLGLKILRDRAKQINASIDIESEPGEGTRVHLEFPLPVV